jgi:flagellar hook assembly protein FlgD
MRRFCRLLFTFLFLSLIPAVVFATVEPTPNLDAAQNYCGPILVFWNTNGAIDPGTQYYVFMSTNDISSNDPATLIADPTISFLIVPYSSSYGNAMKEPITTFLGNSLVTDQTYNFRIAARNGIDWSAHASNELSATCVVESVAYTNVVPSVDGVPGSTINHDSSTLSVSIDLGGDVDGAPFLPPVSFSWDIKTDIDGNTIFLASKQNANAIVNVSSSNYSATAIVTWNGTVPIDKFNKHNETYRFDLWVVDPLINYTGWATFFDIDVVNVVHINFGKELVYQILGNNQPSYGPPFGFDYFMSADSFVTWKIWKHDGTLIRTVVNGVPRRDGDAWPDPGDWNKAVQDESWDGRNSSGTIVPNDIYNFTFDANSYYDHAVTVSGTIAFNVLRIVDIASTGITNSVPLAHIQYTLSGASAQAGGATVKIAICTPGTTFYMAGSAGSMNYLNGTSTYTYTVGDPVPLLASSLKKVFIFARSAGAQNETWNGFDDNGVSLPNANYVFAITAIDDSGNRAIDNSGNNGLFVGNVTIDRTAAQTSTVTSPPSLSGISVGGTNVALTGGVVLTQPFTTLSVTMSDTGGGTISLTGSQVTLTGPTTGTIQATISNNGSNTVTLTFPQQSTNGTYTLNIVPKDTIGNTAPATVYTFTLSISQSGVAAAFASSTFAYPNPAKKVDSISFAYTTNSQSTMKLEVYNILGELIYQDNWAQSQSGAQVRTWNLENQSGNKLATGVYLYRLSSNGTWANFQKLIIIQ